MESQMKSLLAGAAVAALLIFPAFGADPGWVTWPRKSFDVQAVHIKDVIGKLAIDVKDSGPITLDVSGDKRAVDALAVKSFDGRLEIRGQDEKTNVWDWSKWFDFSDINREDNPRLTVHLTVPRHANVDVDDMIGDATIGDTEGPLSFGAVATKARIGKVGPAKISLAGSGRVDIAQVNGDLSLDIAGSGKITTGSTGSVKADLAGSGDAVLGNINGGVNLDIAGSGSFTATRVNGPVHVDIAGAGNVKIASGTADPLHVDIMGSGDLTFGGTAVDPQISALGSGNVRIKAYKGHLSSDGMANVKIGM